MKGIILAGGSGTRLYPLTKAVSKQLMPVYDKPMIYYPLSTLMLAGIRDILIVTTPEDQDQFRRLLGDGSELGISLNYATQPEPGGLPQAFLIGKEFIGKSRVCLILGDNLFYGHGLAGRLQSASRLTEGATIFGYYVSSPERYGVINFDGTGKVIDVEEKPAKPKSHYAVTGIYFFDNSVVSIASELKPSSRGELEIAEVINVYIDQGNINVELFGRGMAWLDTGTHGSLLDAARYIETVEKRQGLKVACLEEVAFRMGYIDSIQLAKLADSYGKSNYSSYLYQLITEN